MGPYRAIPPRGDRAGCTLPRTPHLTGPPGSHGLLHRAARRPLLAQAPDPPGDREPGDRPPGLEGQADRPWPLPISHEGGKKQPVTVETCWPASPCSPAPSGLALTPCLGPGVPRVAGQDKRPPEPTAPRALQHLLWTPASPRHPGFIKRKVHGRETQDTPASGARLASVPPWTHHHAPRSPAWDTFGTPTPKALP